jgi:hypothetical protein
MWTLAVKSQEGFHLQQSDHRRHREICNRAQEAPKTAKEESFNP